MTTSPEAPASACCCADRDATVIEALRGLAEHYPGADIPLGDALDRLGDRAFGLIMLMLALPMATPLSAIPGVSTVIGLPLLVVSVQLLLGFKTPRLPKALARRAIGKETLRRALEKAAPWLDRIERVVHRRWPALTGAVAERLIGAVAVAMTCILALPIPGGNQPPALAVALFAVAISERDGLFAVLGVLASVVSLFILAAIYGLLAGVGIYIFNNAAG